MSEKDVLYRTIWAYFYQQNIGTQKKSNLTIRNKKNCTVYEQAERLKSCKRRPDGL